MNVTPTQNEDFVRRYTVTQPALRRFVMARVPGLQTAEDALQEIAVVLWKKHAQYDPERSFEKWAFGIARYVVRHTHQVAGRQRLVFTEDMESILNDYVEQRVTKTNERQLALRACLETITEKYRKVIDMKYEDGLACNDIAERLGITSRAIRVLLHRIRKSLAKCVQLRMETKVTSDS